MAQITITLDTDTETLGEVLKSLQLQPAKEPVPTPLPETEDALKPRRTRKAKADKVPALEDSPTESAQEPTEAAPEEPATVAEPQPLTPDTPTPDSEALTMPAVRTAAFNLIHSGKGDAVRELMAKYGSGSLSGVPKELYGTLMAELEALKNAG